MNIKQNCENLYRKYVNNVLKQCFIISLTICMLFLAIISFIIWFSGLRQYWIGLASSAIVGLISFLFCFIILKPNDQTFIKRIDELGLQQRAITMNELKDDNSLIARIQRTNTIEHINRINSKMLKLVMPTIMLVIMLISVILGTTLSTVSALSAYDVIDSGAEIFNNATQRKEECKITYLVEGKGHIAIGEAEQVLKPGEKARVLVMEDFESDYFFYKWSDGYKYPYREDEYTGEDIILTAIYIELDRERFDLDRDLLELDYFLGKMYNLFQFDKEGKILLPDTEMPIDYKKDKKNQIIDGQTYYGDAVYEIHYQECIEKLKDNKSLDRRIKKMTEAYFKAIRK